MRVARFNSSPILGIPGTSLCLAGGKASAALHRCEIDVTSYDKFLGNLVVQKGIKEHRYTFSACSAERSFSDPVLLLACLASQTFQQNRRKTMEKLVQMWQHLPRCSERCFGSTQNDSKLEVHLALN